eukprot:8323-Heterococcus_DN1.PRE.1
MDVDAARQLLTQAPALLALLDEKSRLVETQAAQLAELRGANSTTHTHAAAPQATSQQQQSEAADAACTLAIAARDAALAERDAANNRVVQAAKAQEQLHTQIRNLKVEIAAQAAEHALLLLEKDRAVADCKAH